MPKIYIILIFLGKYDTLSFLQFPTACLIWQHRRFDNTLMYGLDKRIVRNSLNKNPSVIMFRRCRTVYLEGNLLPLLL